jgi:hypothetical protein
MAMYMIVMRYDRVDEITQDYSNIIGVYSTKEQALHNARIAFKKKSPLSRGMNHRMQIVRMLANQNIETAPLENDILITNEKEVLTAFDTHSPWTTTVRVWLDDFEAAAKREERLEELADLPLSVTI